MFSLFLLMSVTFIDKANSHLLMGEKVTENFTQFKVLPPGSYKLIFWDQFVNRFYGDLDSSKLFVIGDNSDNNDQLKFKFGAIRTDREKAISERFFHNRLQCTRTENGEFLIKESNANSRGRQTHISIVPLNSDEEPFMSGSEPDSDIAEQTGRVISIDNCTSPTVIHYHSRDRRAKTVLEMFDRWLFGKSKSMSQTDCFFVEAYFRQMNMHLNGLIVHAKYGPPSAPNFGKVEDFELYLEFGASMSRAFHSRQLADRVLMVEDAMAEIRTLCVTVATFRIVHRQQKGFEKLNHWDEICPHLNDLWDAAVSRAIDRWLTEGENDEKPMKMGDANALSSVVEELTTQMQMLSAGAKSANGAQQCMPLAMGFYQLYQVKMLSMFGQKLEMARQRNAKWAEGIMAVSGMLDHLSILCEEKAVITGRECEVPSEWTRAVEAWHSFCPHLNEAQNVWVSGAVGRWLKGEEELMPDEQSMLEMKLEYLAEMMEPDSFERMSGRDIALLHQIGLELTKAKEEKRLAGRVMTVPGIWDQLTNICTLIEGLLGGKWQSVVMTWQDALCSQLEDIYVSAVMNALERWRAGTTFDSDTGVITAGNRRALRTMERVVGSIDDEQQQQKATISKTETVLMAELGAYFAEVIARKAGPSWKEARKLEPIVGMDKLLKRQCSSWAEFRRKIPPESRKMFVSWSKICKRINLKENKKEGNGKMRDEVEENLMKMDEEKKGKRGVKRKEEETRESDGNGEEK